MVLSTCVNQTAQLVPIWELWNIVFYWILTNQVETTVETPSDSLDPHESQQDIYFCSETSDDLGRRGQFMVHVRDGTGGWDIFSFGQFADDSDESPVLILQPLVVWLELR